MIEVKKLTGVINSVNSNFITAIDGVRYRKKVKDNPMMMLSDVFFSKLAHLMGSNAAENDLIDFDYLAQNKKSGKHPNQMVGSKDFLKKGESVLSLPDFLDFCPDNTVNHEAAKIFFNKSSAILQDINLRKFFKHYVEEMPKSFKKDFLNEWWLRTFFRDADQHCCHNMAVVYRDVFRNYKETTISPAHDFEYCMLSDPEQMGLMDFAEKHVKIMDKGLHLENVRFLRKEYRDLSENFLKAIESLRNNPEFDSLCEFSHLAPFFTEIKAFSNNDIKCEKQIYQAVLKEKLKNISRDVRQNCLKRGELLLSQWR